MKVLVAGTVANSTLAKQNGDSMTAKQNISRPSLRVTIHHIAENAIVFRDMYLQFSDYLRKA